MITPEIVKLADRLPEIEKKLVETRSKNAKAREDEEKRHRDAVERLLLEDGSIAAEHAQACRAKRQIFEAVPLELHRAANQAGSAYRDAAQRIKYERDQRSAAAEALKAYKGPAEGAEPLEEQLEAAEEALQRAESNLADLKKADEKAQASVDAALQKVRREALAAKVERATRG